MATFTITTTQNIDALAGKTGGDTYNINGGTLTIDQDSRYGTNASTSASLGPVTISATLGGTVNIDARYVRLIPYNTGAGNVPASGTTITQGSASGTLIGVWSSLTAAPTAAGVAMPASGFIKIKAWNSVAYAAGALTGISATATGVDTVGWIDVIGDEASTLTAVRLGQVNITGELYQLGTTSGTANQTFQVPTSGLNRYTAGVWIERSVGSNDYEFYASAGSQTTVAADIRAKVVWCTTAGIVRLGHNGTANAGYTPVSGLKVMIGNIFFENCTTAARTANALPNATLATRYDFTTSGGGVITADKCNMAWYCSFAQPYSINLSYFGTLEQISLSECASAITWNRVGVGQTAAQAQVSLVMSLNFAGGTIYNCHFTRATLAASGTYNITITDCDGFDIQNQLWTSLTVKGNATSGNLLATRMNNTSINYTNMVNGRAVFVTCSNVSMSNTNYVDVITGTTTTTTAQQSYVWEISSNSQDITLNGVAFLSLTNVQAYLGILSVAAAGCTRIKLRNIGTYASPLTLGSTNAGAYLVNFANGAAANDVRIQRCYVSNTRTGLYTADNSSTKITFEDVFSDYADAPTAPVLNGRFKNVGSTFSLTAQTAVYGTHWISEHTSTTAGRLQLMMNEQTSLETTYSTISGTPKFTSAGGLYMPNVGDEIEFETPYYIIGHTAFQNSALVMGGGTVGNYRFDYAIDKNDGAGYSTMTTSDFTAAGLATSLNGLTGLSGSLGFKLKLRISTTTANTSAITSVYLLMTSTTTSQAFQHPLDTVTVRVTAKDASDSSLIQNARVRLIASGGGPQSDGTVLLTGLTDASGVLQTTTFNYLGEQEFTGIVRKASASPLYKPSPASGTITSVGADVTVFLILDE